MTKQELINLLNQHHIEYKQGVEEIQVCCPTCKDVGFHMQLNLSTVSKNIKGWAFCYKKWHAMPISQYFRYLNLKIDIEQPVWTPMSGFDHFSNTMRGLLQPDQIPVTPRSNKNDINSLVSSFYKFDFYSNGITQRPYLDYLHSRGFNNNHIIEYQLHWCHTGLYANRIIIPFYDSTGWWWYFQARDITDIADHKLLNPPKDMFTEGKSDLLYNMFAASKYQEVVICEGWASAISAGMNAVGLSGKKASHAQLRLLMLWNKHIVMLDADARVESYELARQLISAGSKSVRVVELPAGDPNDYETLSLQKLMSSFTLISNNPKLERLQAFKRLRS